jgi:hypothetical protein
LVAAADIKKKALRIEFLRLSRIGKFYDNFAIFREEAARNVP